MTNSNRTDVLYILDQSSSMHSQRDEVVDAFTKQLADNQKLEGDIRVSLTLFATGVNHVYTDVPAAEVEPLDYAPRGSTSLLDAVAETILAAGERYKQLSEDERPSKVLVFIMTDGQENSSSEFSLRTGGQARVKDMVEHQREKYGWEFVFLGQGLDVAVGHNLGVRHVHAPVSLSAAVTRNSEVLRSYSLGEGVTADVMKSYSGT